LRQHLLESRSGGQIAIMHALSEDALLWEQRVGGSNPSAPTMKINDLLYPSAFRTLCVREIVRELWRGADRFDGPA